METVMPRQRMFESKRECVCRCICVWRDVFVLCCDVMEEEEEEEGFWSGWRWLLAAASTPGPGLQYTVTVQYSYSTAL